jgi:DNA-binding transcriptional MerR regulator
MGTHQPIRKIVAPAPTEIPDKLYFRIGDVAKLCALPAYVLRFWETEFPQLKPHKGGTGQRLYRKRDVEMALRIKSLLYEQGYTIPGARQVFKAEPKSAPVETSSGEAMALAHAHVPATGLHRETQLQSIRNELTALVAILSRPVAAHEVAAHEVPAPARLKTMKPRLVLEPNPRPKPVAMPTPMRLEQPGLFGFDTSEFAEPTPSE